MTYSEDELLPLSALQHLAFCERQCALIHVEQAWAENRLTVEGKILHEKVHEADAESRGNVRIVRGLRLRCLGLGLVGVADVVEFHRVTAGVPLPGIQGLWQPFPVEYKRGKPKSDECDEVQLCGQALCMEEMLTCSIPSGALFYGSIRRRHDVVFDATLRRRAEVAAARLHELIEAGLTPPAEYSKKCEKCSLLNLCMPRTAGKGKSVAGYLRSQISNLKSQMPDNRKGAI